MIQRRRNKCTKNQEQKLEMTSNARMHVILLASRFEEKCFHWHCGVVGENVHIKMDICVMVLPTFFLVCSLRSVRSGNQHRVCLKLDERVCMSGKVRRLHMWQAIRVSRPFRWKLRLQSGKTWKLKSVRTAKPSRRCTSPAWRNRWHLVVGGQSCRSRDSTARGFSSAARVQDKKNASLFEKRKSRSFGPRCIAKSRCTSSSWRRVAPCVPRMAALPSAAQVELEP